MSSEAILLADMQKTIEAHLPGAVGSVLLSRLKHADEDANTVKILRAENNDLSQKVATLGGRESAVNNASAAVAAREVKVAEREKFMDRNEAQLNAAKDKVQFAREMVGMVFANNRY